VTKTFWGSSGKGTGFPERGRGAAILKKGVCDPSRDSCSSETRGNQVCFTLTCMEKKKEKVLFYMEAKGPGELNVKEGVEGRERKCSISLGGPNAGHFKRGGKVGSNKSGVSGHLVN